MYVPKTSLLSIHVLLMRGANVHSENVTVSGPEEMNDDESDTRGNSGCRFHDI